VIDGGFDHGFGHLMLGDFDFDTDFDFDKKAEAITQ
jgi:hypothetical protein